MRSLFTRLTIAILCSFTLIPTANAQAQAAQCTTSELDLMCADGQYLQGISPLGHKLCKVLPASGGVSDGGSSGSGSGSWQKSTAKFIFTHYDNVAVGTTRGSVALDKKKQRVSLKHMSGKKGVINISKDERTWSKRSRGIRQGYSVSYSITFEARCAEGWRVATCAGGTVKDTRTCQVRPRLDSTRHGGRGRYFYSYDYDFPRNASVTCEKL